jgi:hypothetical protein
MNCQEVNFMLDVHAPEDLRPGERQTVELHFASCQACRDAWAAYREIAAQPIPKMPQDLRLRIAVALAARAPAETRWPRRSLLLGGVLAVGAAVAAGIAMQVAERAPAITRIDEPTPAAAPSLPADLAPPAGAPVAENGAAAIAGADAAALPSDTATNPATLALDPHSIVVFAERDPAASPRANTEFAKCHEQVLAQLRAVQGLNVIAGERVAAFDPFNLPLEEIARELGAGTALLLRIMSHQPSCSATQIDTQTGAESLGIMVFVDSEQNPDGWKFFAARIAEAIRDAAFKDRTTVIAEAQATVLNVALSDAERASALGKLPYGPPDGPTSSPVASDDAVVAAATQIAMSSRDARARAVAWVGLRGIDDPDLIQPLLYSLANDADENVRRAAAFALAYFVDEPGVRDGLARAAAEDPSQDRAGSCCTPTVREAAERSLLSEQELHELALKTVMNEALTDQERLRPITSSPDGRGLRVPLNDEAARAIFDMGRRSEDAGLRSQAWWSIARAGAHPEFAQVLLADLTSHPEENVRGAAAAGLADYTDDPVVRTGLERAMAEDASQNVRREARAALGGVAR